MVVAGAGRRGDGESLFTGSGGSVWDDGKF